VKIFVSVCEKISRNTKRFFHVMVAVANHNRYVA
jgi:uncharacterized short protein YbdD (DUF466 family)